MNTLLAIDGSDNSYEAVRALNFFAVLMRLLSSMCWTFPGQPIR